MRADQEAYPLNNDNVNFDKLIHTFKKYIIFWTANQFINVRIGELIKSDKNLIKWI